jgi:hypothetical protein
MKTKKLLLIGIMLGLFLSITLALNGPNKKLVPYTLVSKTVVYQSDGSSVEAYSEVKYVSSKGQWRSVKSFPNGRTLEQFAEVGRGIFTIDKTARKMFFESPFSPQKETVDEMKQIAGYSRTETVMGYATLVFTHATAEGSVEIFRAIDLNGDTVKYIMKRGAVTTVVEPVSIQLGEPAPGTLDHSEYSMDFSKDKKKRIPERRLRG